MLKNTDAISVSTFVKNMKDYHAELAEESRLSCSPWVPTTISGLDFLLNGGLLFPYFMDKTDKYGKGMIVLIKGTSGSGKTTLAAKMMLGVLQCEKRIPQSRHCYHEIDQKYKGYKLDNNLEATKYVKHPGPTYAQYTKYIHDVLRSHQKAHVFNCEHNKEEYENLLKRLNKRTFTFTGRGNNNEQISNHVLGIDKHDMILRTISYDTLYEKKGKRENRTYDQWFNDLLVQINKYSLSVEKQDPGTGGPKQVIVIDGLNSFPAITRRSIDHQNMIRILRKAALLTIIVYEDEKDHHENLDYLADMVIQLKGEENRIDNHGYYLNKLIIEKSRFQSSVRGWQQYKITDRGFVVFPTISSLVAKHDTVNDYVDYASSGSIEDMFYKNQNCTNSDTMHYLNCSYCRHHKDSREIRNFIYKDYISVETSGTDGNKVQKWDFLIRKISGKDIMRGSTTAILGPKHTFKFYMGLDFLRSGSSQEEHGLMVLFQDRQPRLDHEKQRLCKWACLYGQEDHKCRLCYNNVHTFQVKPKWITPAEFMHHLTKILEAHARHGQAITRLALCDLVQMENKFPFLADDVTFIPTLLTFLKLEWGITTVVIGASNNKMGRQVSEISDNIIYTWLDSIDIEGEDTTHYAFYSSHADRCNSRDKFCFISWDLLYQDVDIQIDVLPKDASLCWDYLNDHIKEEHSKYALAKTMQRKIWDLHGMSDSGED